MLVVHDHCVKVGRAVNNGRPGFVVRGTYYATFSYPRILRKVDISSAQISSEVSYRMGHLRAFAAIWLLGTMICLPLLMVLIEIPLGFCLNQLWWHITSWKKCWAFSPLTMPAGGTKKPEIGASWFCHYVCCSVCRLCWGLKGSQRLWHLALQI